MMPRALTGMANLHAPDPVLIKVISLCIPEGYYYLADAGFGSCDTLLTLYQGVRYHLREWAQGNQKYVPYHVYSHLHMTH